MDASFEINEYGDLTYDKFILESGGALFQVGEQFLKPDIAERGKQLIKACPKFNWADKGVIVPPRYYSVK